MNKTWCAFVVFVFASFVLIEIAWGRDLRVLQNLRQRIEIFGRDFVISEEAPISIPALITQPDSHSRSFPSYADIRGTHCRVDFQITMVNGRAHLDGWVRNQQYERLSISTPAEIKEFLAELVVTLHLPPFSSNTKSPIPIASIVIHLPNGDLPVQFDKAARLWILPRHAARQSDKVLMEVEKVNKDGSVFYLSREYRYITIGSGMFGKGAQSAGYTLYSFQWADSWLGKLFSSAAYFAEPSYGPKDVYEFLGIDMCDGDAYLDTLFTPQGKNQIERITLKYRGKESTSNSPCRSWYKYPFGSCYRWDRVSKAEMAAKSECHHLDFRDVWPLMISNDLGWKLKEIEHREK